MRKKGQIICDGCGRKLDYVLVDGYGFGDKMMEGVMFKVRLSDSGWVCEGMKDKDTEAYMEQFNWDYWSERCEEFVAGDDVAECPYCGDQEVGIWDEEE